MMPRVAKAQSILRGLRDKLLSPFADLIEIWRWLREGSDFYYTISDSFSRTGRLPYSSKIEGTFYRWHSSDHLWTGSEFSKTFEDGPWKWRTRQRYAGEDLNAGHYFSLTEEGATAEAAFYGITQGKANVMLAIDAEFESLLDLTYEGNIRAVVAALVENPETAERCTFAYILSHLIDIDSGGNSLTDFIGRWAATKGYCGVLFFSARSLKAIDRLVIDQGKDDQGGVYVADWIFEDMRSNKSVINLMIFAGSLLTRRIRTYRIDNGEEIANPYFGRHKAELDKVLAYNEDYQLEQINKCYLRGGLYLPQ